MVFVDFLLTVSGADLPSTNASRSPPRLKSSLCQSPFFFGLCPPASPYWAQKSLALLFSLPLFLLRRAVDRSGHRERCFCFDARRSVCVFRLQLGAHAARPGRVLMRSRLPLKLDNTVVGFVLRPHHRATMSNVRLSNGSPTLERMEARLSDQPKPSACRNLFGPVDHEELKKDLQRHLKAMEDASAEEWNFDISTHTPRANGRYQWEALDIRSVPGFYSQSERGKGTDVNICSSGNNNDNTVDVNGNHDCRVTEESAETPESPIDQRKRTACQDSSCQSKRARTCMDEVTRTPRKPKKPRKHPGPTPTKTQRGL